ncbi:hypothetical protein [Bacillus sp. SD088]|uniref:hypothetical protein n=1 Tax=Bacillus sp. SD088 TaxID=2782012 RepID=UPI001A963557|nr:hypothetical protein [Bacillus sp. SD088]MBO0994403.1 ABC transporter permease [Bacillus sp. SD088]
MATIRSEFTKIITLRSVWIITFILLAVGLFFHYQSAVGFLESLKSIDENGMHWEYRRPINAELDFYSTIGTAIFNPGILFPLLGATIAGAEFRTGQLGVSLLAVPSRTQMVISKIIATIIYTLGIGITYTIMSLITAYFMIKDWRPEFLWSPQVYIKISGGIFFLVAITLITLGFTLITRRTLLGILIMGGFIGVTMSQAIASFAPAVDAWTPISAARNLLLQEAQLPDMGPLFSSSNLMGGMVLMLWLIGVLIISLILLKRRDAR